MVRTPAPSGRADSSARWMLPSRHLAAPRTGLRRLVHERPSLYEQRSRCLHPTFLNVVQEAFRTAFVMRPFMSASERRAQLKDSLLRAAERAIETHGLEGVRARDLAREAGCAVGAIYNVFEDLDSLVLQVNLRTLASLEAFLAQTAGREVEDDTGDTEAALGDLVRLSADYLA